MSLYCLMQCMTVRFARAVDLLRMLPYSPSSLLHDLPRQIQSREVWVRDVIRRAISKKTTVADLTKVLAEVIPPLDSISGLAGRDMDTSVVYRHYHDAVNGIVRIQAQPPCGSIQLT